jgi:hypothetical protein
MVSYQLAAVLAAVVAGCLAKTPSGFEPASNADLVVEFAGVAGLNGAVLSKEGWDKKYLDA